MPTVATAVVSGLQSLARAIGPSHAPERMSEAILIPLDPRTGRIRPGPSFRFQYFPASLTSSKQTNWQQKEIPGASLPLYQFVAGGEHTLTFTAQFTSDTDLLANPELHETLRSDGLKEHNPDIRAAVAWLRQFVTPSYQSGSALGAPLTQPPKKVLLFMPGTGIGLLAGAPTAAPSVQPHSVPTIMTQCEVTYEAFFASGLPRLVQVQLSFAQVAQYGGTVQFPGVTGLHDELLSTGGPFKPYQLLSRATPTGAR